MQDYIIMTDSCCDLTDQMARELELEVLPLTMHMDGQDYPNTLDGALHQQRGVLPAAPGGQNGHHLRRQRGPV